MSKFQMSNPTNFPNANEVGLMYVKMNELVKHIFLLIVSYEDLFWLRS